MIYTVDRNQYRFTAKLQHAHGFVFDGLIVINTDLQPNYNPTRRDVCRVQIVINTDLQPNYNRSGIILASCRIVINTDLQPNYNNGHGDS